MSYYWVRGFAIAVIVILATAIGDRWLFRNARRPTSHSLPLIEFDPLRDMPTMPWTAAGVSDPWIVSVAEARLKDSDVIIGVVVSGEPRAYLRRAFEGGPRAHVVNDRIGSISVTVTHCDLTRSTRVLTGEDSEEAMTIGCGGWVAHEGMALQLNDEVYAQLSPDLPLSDLPFEVTTWAVWLESHPDTMVYQGIKREM